MKRFGDFRLASVFAGCVALLLGGCDDGGETQFPPTPTGSAGSGAIGGGGTGGVAGGGATGGGGMGGAGAAGGQSGDYTIDTAVESWHQPALQASVHFAPHDGLEAHVLRELGAAQTSLHLAFFNLRLDEVRDLLDQKQNAGLDVHVVLDKKQQDLAYNTMAQQLRDLGVTVTEVENTSATHATMHDKFTVIDGERVLTGSANYSMTALNISDEDLLTFEDAALAARYELEFAELIAGGNTATAPYTASDSMQPWWGTEDALRDKIVSALDAAQSTALCAMFDLNTTEIVDALIAAHNRSVSVVVVLDEAQATDVGATADETLIAAGVPVILADNTGSSYAEMHSKFVVVDHQQVTLGSYNWTDLGSYHNDENIVIIDDAHLAARVEGKFAQLIDDYATVTPASLGLVEADQQVTFQVTNVTTSGDAVLSIRSESGGPWPTRTALDGSDQISVTVPAGTRIEYRYSIVEQGTVLAEEGRGHSFTVPYATGPFSVTDAYTP